MNKQDLLQLEKLSAFTPNEIAKEQPALHTKLSQQAAISLKNTAKERLKGSREEIKAGFSKISFALENIGKEDVKTVLTEKMLASSKSAKQKKELEEITARIPSLGKIEDILQPDVPVIANPMFHQDLTKAKFYRLSDVAGLPQTKADKSLGKELSLNTISNQKLEELVKDKTLTDMEAKALGLASNLFTLVDSNFELAEQVKKSVKPQSLKDLVVLNQAAWEKMIKDSKMELPKGLKTAEYAEVLYNKVESLFPEAALAHHITQVKAEEIEKNLVALKPLLQKNPNAFGIMGADGIKTGGFTSAEGKKYKTSFEEINRISNLHPGLKLDKVLNDKKLSELEKGKIVAERIALFSTFVENNANVNFLSLDYRHDSNDLKTLNFGDMKAAEKTMLLNSVKAYQRVYAFTNDVEDTETIMAAGFQSSYQVSSVTLEKFINATNLDIEKATQYFENANHTIIRTTGIVGSIIDIIKGGFDWTAVGNITPDISGYLRDIPGYEDLFGTMAFCDCKDCQSIYSPAAYFVDLIEFIDRHVLSKHFTGAKASHVLNLKTRRPDLWTLPLTCENTNTLIPYLVIINEILESYIAKKKGYVGDLNNHAAVEEFVCKKEIALEKPGTWKSFVHSFKQPFHLPMTSVSTYLGHFEKTREDIAILLNKPQNTISKTRLSISEKEYALIITTDAAPAFMAQVYGFSFTLSGTKITPLDSQQLIKSMKVNRTQLEKIFGSNFVTNYGAETIIIQGEKISPDSVQFDIEKVRNLTYGVLERAHRFVRLWRKTPWSIEELDLVLGQLKSAGIASGINADAITAVGNLLRLQEKLKVSVEELSGIWYRVPTLSIKENQKSLFDKLFNQEDMVVAGGLYPKDTTRLIHPSLILNKSTSPGEFSSDRLMVALNLADNEVLALIQNLASPLGIVALNSPMESGRGFFLNNANLSLLYRHSKIAKFLHLSIPDFFRLIKLIAELPNGYIENTSQIYKVLEFYTWWKTTPFTLDDLYFITEKGNLVTPEKYKTKEEITSMVLEQTKAANALLFADTLFSYFDDVTEEQSKAILDANSAVIEVAPDGRNYWLKAAFNASTAITVPVGISRPEPELRSLLIKYHPKYLLPFQLSGQLKLSEDTITRLITHLGVDLDADAFTLELQGVTTPAVVIPALIEKLLPISIFYKGGKSNADSLVYMLTHLPIFGIGDMDHLSIDNIQKYHSFTQYIEIKEDGSSNVSKLMTILAAYANTTQYQTANQAALAEILQTKSEVLATIHPVAGSSTNALLALDHYKKLVEVCDFIGIGGNVLEKIVSQSYTDLDEATQSILAAFQSKYKSETERKEKLSKYQDLLLSKKREAITDYLIHSGFPQFEDEDDLFNYFLIDTELEGCARTSRLVAATMSLQLYVHRVLLNLEQDKQDPGTANRVYVPASEIPEDEWDWRKNYRVWEANRKVFLYPENYIEPDLRDDKTPLFKELESELLQQEINADNVLEAYGKYMRGFDEVAHLKIAGSYHEKDSTSETDVLHLFGVTAGDPPIYYYRAVENLYYSEKRNDRGVVWGPWQKINVQIPVRKVAPITYNGRLHVFWVKVTTMANTVFHDNESVFVGYSHKFSIEFTTLKLDGTWTAPQKINLKDCYPFEGNGVVYDPLADKIEISSYITQLSAILQSFPFFNFSTLTDEMEALKTPRYDTIVHYEPKDEYTLQGFLWDQMYPSIDSSNRLALTGAGYQLRGVIDFYNLSIQNNGYRDPTLSDDVDPVKESLTVAINRPGKIILKSGNVLYRATSPSLQLFDHFAYGSLIVNTTKSDPILSRHWDECTLQNCFDNVTQEQIAYLRSGSQVQIINGAYGDAVIDVQGDLFLLQGTAVDGNGFNLKRISTTLSETLTRTLFTSGVDTTLSIVTQKALKEAPVPLTITAGRINNKVVINKIDFTGAYGTYYREIFFHIPFLIANHLNSQGKYADAQKWYQYIFNPSATEVISLPAGGLSTEQKKKLELDRNWQYLEFREVGIQKLRDQLNDKQAIEVYKKDPFSPHAIARLRLSAYQKCIVMKYIDNLLDWGDQLFTQDTMESVNEASLLYIIAKEILGDRPAQIGGCGEGKVTPKTYANIQPLLEQGSEFLSELESYIYGSPQGFSSSKDGYIAVDNSTILEKAKLVAKKVKAVKKVNYTATTYMMNFVQEDQINEIAKAYMPEVSIVAVNDSFSGAFAKGTIRALTWLKDSIYVKDKNKLPSFGWSFIKQISPVFCIPGNKDFLGYFDRVDDRLYKIRNCMNILGQKRQLALFAPEIDPRLLVRAKAAGLTLDDILNSISGNLPPYRFTYILEKARAFTSVIQSFGASLLSAIEKKNGEELALLRLTQQQNILKMTSKSRKLEIDSAMEGVKALNDKITSLSYQIEYYKILSDERINEWELAQSIGRHAASIIRGTEAAIAFSAGILSLLPQLGSPFAMKYGGVELGGSMGKIAFAMTSLANLGDNIAASSGLEAGFERRRDGWNHQIQLLKYELTQAEKNLKIAEFRRDILIEAELIHQKTMEHNQDVMDFYGEKFTNFGLYTWLSATMQRLYKEAFNNAISIARLAEQAYRYERDDNTIFIDGNYFESPRAGLLAGERLLLALQNMERRYLETNYRKNEIDQAFSLTQIDPQALMSLKQTGTCDFSIPEVFFDLFYPGQYKRKIQSIRLTIPCVTGPYINISATLSLMSSQIRMEAKLGSSELKDVPKSRTTTIATSTAQNDAGVFQINFKDERYMPFEGAGAISSWKLSLPKNFRQFDYNTINDVIIHVSYTAEYDELFRDKVEEKNEAIEGTIINILKNNPISRVFSLRQEFSTDFHRLTEQPLNTAVTIQIQDKHFPLFMSENTLQVTAAKLVLVTPTTQTVAGLNIKVDGVSQTGFLKDPDFGNLYAKNLGSLFNAGIIKDHTLAIVAAGDLAAAAPAVGPTPALDTEKLKDIVLYVEYQIG